MENTSIGSVLTIPDGLLKNLEKVDERLDNIKKKAKETETVFNASFEGMNAALDPFLPNLQKIVDSLKSAATQSKKMGDNMDGAVKGVNNLNGSITAAIEVINRMRTLIQNPTPNSGNFMSHVSTLVDAISVRISGMGTKFKDFKKQLLELDTAAMQQAMKAQSDAKVRLINEQTATILAKENLEQKKQNRLYAQAATEAAKLARAEAQLAQARAMAATAQERATAANERAARRATIRQYGADATSAMSYVNSSANTGTFNQRAIAIKVLEEAIKNLNKTDKDYQKNLQELSNKYRELKAEQDKVVGSYREMQQHHRSLMDTTGQLQRAFALMFSVSQIRGYINQIAQVRGEFELQQRSLEAILQNKTEADAIFNKTVALAVQSPFQIKDLISYTKQLAAYRIESDKLYDTTKMLADVSAGLGVDMQRLILAYGQVKAAAYLRGTEVRQFTEAGINLYGELQAYFKEVKQESYTTAQIVDMISKRMVTFEDIERIFERLTKSGGLFYNMQAIQAETLQGKIANLKDSIDVMLNDIGKANEGSFKGAIDGANTLLRNWESVVEVGKRVVEILLLLKLQSIKTGVAMSSAIRGGTNLAAFTKTREGLNGLSVAFLRLGNYAKSAGLMLKSAFMSNVWIFAAIEAATAIYKIIEGYNQFNEARVKAVSEFNKEIYSLKELKAAYTNLGSESAKSSKTELNSISDKRKALEELVGKMSKEGLKINFKVDALADNELEKYFNSSLQRYQRFLSDKLKLDILYEKNKRDTYIVDNVEDDLKDYSTAAADLIAESDKVDTAIANLSAKYNQLPKEAKAAFDELANMQGDNTDLDYIQKRIEKLNEIRWYITEYKPTNGGGAYSVGSEAFKDEYNQLVELSKLAKRYIEQKKELLVVQKKDGKYLYEGELANLAAELQNQFARSVQQGVKDGLTKKEAMKQAALDVDLKIKTLQASKQVDDFGADLLRKSGDFKVYFNIDKPNAKRQIDLLDDMIQKTIGDKTYKLRFAVSKTFFDELIDSIDDAGKIVDAKKKWEDVIDSGGKITWGYAKEKDTSFETWYRNTYRPGWKNKVISDQMELSKLTLTEYAKYRQKLARATLDAYGVKSKGDEKADKAAEKAQRDLIKERIEAYKELQSQYEKYLKMYDKETAKTKALESLKYKLQNAGIYGDALGIFPDEKTIAEKIKGLAAQYKDLSKRGDAYKVVADLMLQIDQEQLKKELDAAKNQIDDAFSGLNVYTDLKKLGLGESDIAKMFGDLPKTFDDVQKKIAEVYNGKEGPKWAKQREETEKKLQEQVVKYNLDTFKELTKAYKTQLSDQLQLDEWYYSERMKIMQNEQLKANPEMQKQYLANLDKQYAEKSDANSWKQFQESEYYIKIFENLDVVSSRVLKEMSSRLENIRGSLKNLSPEQLKQVVSATEQINAQLVRHNPFKGLLKNIKEYAAFQKKRNELEKNFIDSSAKEADLQSQSKQQSEIVRQKKEEYDAAVKTHGAMSGQAGIAYNAYKTEKEKLDIILDELVAQGKITQAYADQIRNGEKIKKTLQEQVKGIADQFSQLSSGWGEFESMMNNFGVEFPEEIGGALNGLSQASGGISKIVNGDIIGGLFSTISGVGNTVASLFGFGNKDNKLQKRIEEQERAIKRLQWAYEDLKESMDNAMSAADLLINKDDMIDNLNATNASLRSMISMEQSKKHTDSGKIEEWQRQIQENNKAIKELEQTVTEQMGGFGSDSNFKSAAQEFADAWVDAFNEGSDALEALEGKFDDYFNNLLKKQLMMRAADTYIKPILAAFDAAVAEGSAGGNNGLDVTEEELNRIKELKDTNLALFDEYAKGLMEILGVSPTTSASLSDLQQGIQSLSESTGQALESLLNSIRFFVAQQSTDVAAIRQLLAAGSSLNTTTDTNTPMLKELQAQTNYLSKMYSLWSSVIKSGGHPKAGAGIKVFQD